MPRRQEPTLTQTMLNQYVNGSQVAEILGITPGRVTQLSDAGRLPFLTSAAGRLYPRREIELLARGRKRRAKQRTTAT